MTMIFIASGITVLVILCVLAHNIGYNAGYGQAINDVREQRRKERAAL